MELQKETGMTFIHPYDDELVIAGQGTIGLEILDQLPDVEAVVVPVGGGGLLAGVAFAIKSLRPDVKIYGVQAAGAASMYNAYRDHTYETLDHVDTFADGIAVKTPGETTFKMIEQYVDGIVTVSEDEIAAAILALMENQKLVAEGAGATPVAAAFKQLVFKISCSAYKILAPRSGQHGTERRHNVGLQNTAENHKAVQPGAHGIQLHHSQFLQECKNACSVYSV